MKRTKNILLKVFLILCILTMILFILIQSGVFNGLIRDIIISSANKTLNAELDIENIRGNPFRNYEINNISLRTEEEILISIKQIKYRMNPVKLIRRQIQIDILDITEPYINLSLSEDKVWNLTKIAGENPSQSKSEVDRKREFNWDIRVERSILTNGKVNISSVDSGIDLPDQIRGINLVTSQSYIDEELILKIEEFELETIKSDNKISDLKLIFKLIEDRLILEDLLLITRNSRMTLSADVETGEKPAGDLDLVFDPLNIAEICEFIPELKLQGEPKITVEANFINDFLNSVISIKENDQEMIIDTEISDLSGDTVFELSNKWNNIDLSRWTADPELRSDLNGELLIKGKNRDPEESDLEINLSLIESNISDRKIKNLDLRINKSGSDADLTMNSNSAAGSISMNGRVENIFKNPEYKLDLQARQTDLSAILLADEFNSELNFDCSISGSGINPERLAADLLLTIFSSHYNNIPLDSLRAEISYNSEEYQISEFKFHNPIAQLDIAGNGSITGVNDLNFNLKLDDLSPLKDQINADELQAEGLLEGNVKGKFDSLRSEINFKLNNIKYNNTQIKGLEIESNIEMRNDIFYGNIQGEIEQSRFGEFTIDSVSVSSDFSDQKAFLFLFKQIWTWLSI